MNKPGLVFALGILLASSAIGQEPVVISPAGPSLPTGVVGQPYSTAFTALPTDQYYYWDTDPASPLPSGLGLTLDQFSGLLSGTPAVIGNFSFTVRVGNGDGTIYASRSYNLRINAPLNITTTNLASAVVGAPYSQSIAATGGQTPYTWSITGVTFPTNGLSFNTATGVISGTPTAGGVLTFNATVADNANPQQVSAPRSFSLVIQTALAITTTALNEGVVGRSYTSTLTAVGGTTPHVWSYTFPSGAPPGLTFGANGQITGSPTQAGSFPVNVQVRDSATLVPQQTANASFVLTVYGPLSITTTTLPSATRTQAYTGALQATGGKTPYTWGVDSNPINTVAPGVLLGSNGAISGTPTQAGTFNFTPFVQDAGTNGAQQSDSETLTFRVFDPLTITTASLPNVVSGSAYSQTLAAAGGEPSYTWAVISGALPAGVTLSSGGLISGTPTVPGDYSVQVRATDSRAGGARTATRTFALAVTAGVLEITTASPLPAGRVGTAYSLAFAASPTASGLTWSITAGALPAGLALSPAGVLAGTPTAHGAFSFTVAVQNPAIGATGSKAFTLAVSPTLLTITTTSPLPPGTYNAPYSQQLTATGGLPPYAWSLASGALPEGLTLSAGGLVSGTPRAFGNFTFTARVSDSGVSTQGQQAERQFALEIRTTTLTWVTPSQLGTIEDGGGYTLALLASGGVPPYTFTAAGGALPTGVTMNAAGLLTGSPEAGVYRFSVRVSDRSEQSATREFTLTVNERRIPLQILTVSLPDGNVGRLYGATFSARGGTPVYTWSFSGLPAGLTGGADGGITGTPTAVGTSTVTVQVADSDGKTATGTFPLTIRPGTIFIEPSSAREGQVDTAYSIQFSASGGLAPYRFSLSGATPAGLSFNGGLLSGTPTEAGTFTFTVEVTDEAQQRGQRGYTLVIRPAQLTITTSTLPGGQLGRSYSASLAATGGVKPYSWVLSGSVPDGLSVDAATGAISGTPTTLGTFSVSAQVTDQNNATATRAFTVAVRTPLTISGTLPSSGAVGTALSGSLTVTGGLAPYKWSITAGSPPPGTTFSDGSLSGTPTTTGSFTFTVQVTDSDQATTSSSATIQITGGLTITTESLGTGRAGSSYSATLGVSGGVAPYQWTGSGLPAGLSMSAGGTISGTPTESGTFSVSVGVTDASQPALSASKTLSLQIGLPLVTGVVIGGVPETAPPAQQPTLTLTIGAPFPSAIQGTVTLTFAPDAVNNSDDPAIRFSNGGRSATFTIPTGSTQAVFPGTPSIQTGTVAGTITLTTALTSGGNPVSCDCPLTRTIRIDRSAPVISSVRVTRTANGFSVVITGFSTSREVTQGLFRFTGTNLQTTEATVPLTQAMTTWFQSSASTSFGGQFVLTMPFTIQGDANAVTQVSVALSNASGTSQTVSASF